MRGCDRQACDLPPRLAPNCACADERLAVTRAACPAGASSSSADGCRGGARRYPYQSRALLSRPALQMTLLGMLIVCVAAVPHAALRGGAWPQHNKSEPWWCGVDYAKPNMSEFTVHNDGLNIMSIYACVNLGATECYVCLRNQLNPDSGLLAPHESALLVVPVSFSHVQINYCGAANGLNFTCPIAAPIFQEPPYPQDVYVPNTGQIVCQDTCAAPHAQCMRSTNSTLFGRNVCVECPGAIIDRPCNSSGTCVVPQYGPQASCQCSGKWIGPDCTLPAMIPWLPESNSTAVHNSSSGSSSAAGSHSQAHGHSSSGSQGQDDPSHSWLPGGISLPVFIGIAGGAFLAVVVVMYMACSWVRQHMRPKVVTTPKSPDDRQPLLSRSSVSLSADLRISCPTIPADQLQVKSRIASGAYGEVFMGIYQGTPVAIKEIPCTDARVVRDFERETAILSRTRHPHVVQLYGVCERKGFLRIVTELMRTSLHQLITSRVPMTPDLKLAIALDVAKGMAFLHAQNLIHRDLKPANVLLDENNRAKLCDFGLARLGGGLHHTKTALVGTPAYMAPECMSQHARYSAEVDVYSYGVLLSEVLMWQLAYSDRRVENIFVFREQVCRDNLRPTLSDFASRIESNLASLARRCWDGVPARRPTFAQIVDELEELVVHGDSRTSSPATVPRNLHQSNSSLSVVSRSA